MNESLNNITIENRKRINVSGVLEVLSFTDKELRLELIDKTKLQINGENLKIVGFNKDSKVFVADGTINQIKYLNKNLSTLKRIFG